MRRRTQLRLEPLECRETPSAGRLFATSQDVGNHVFVYAATGPIIVGGDGQILNSGSGRLVASFDAYAAPFAGGVRLALGDVTGDGVEDLVTSPASGGGPHIKVFDGLSLLNGRAVLVKEFAAFDPNFRGGTYLAVGQVDPSTHGQEIIVSAGIGGGPHVRVFGLNRADPIRDFFAFDASFRGGVRVASADLNGDGRAEVVAAMGPGGSPTVRVFDLRSSQPRMTDEFLAYDRAFTGGVYVAAGELDGHGGLADIATGAGEGGGPHVKIWSTSTLDGHVTKAYDFMAGDSNSRAGVRVAVGNLGQLTGVDTLYVGDGNGRAGRPSAQSADPRLRAYNRSQFITMVIPGTPGPTTFFDYTESQIDLFDGFARTSAGGLNLG
jgi:hypothetical protein